MTTCQVSHCRGQNDVGVVLGWHDELMEGGWPRVEAGVCRDHARALSDDYRGTEPWVVVTSAPGWRLVIPFDKKPPVLYPPPTGPMGSQ